MGFLKKISGTGSSSRNSGDGGDKKDNSSRGSGRQEGGSSSGDNEGNKNKSENSSKRDPNKQGSSSSSRTRHSGSGSGSKKRSKDHKPLTLLGKPTKASPSVGDSRSIDSPPNSKAEFSPIQRTGSEDLRKHVAGQGQVVTELRLGSHQLR